MKILLDECLPRRLKRMFAVYDVVTVQEMGWAGTKNGALLRLAEKEIDVFITSDQNLTHQQNLRASRLSIIVLVAPNNRLGTLQALIPQVILILAAIKPGETIHIGTLG